MLGEDTIVYTRGGFKKVKELELFDEVLTPFGDFEPVIELGTPEYMTYMVELDGVEKIYCTGNLLWNMSTATRFTDDISSDDVRCAQLSFPLEYEEDFVSFDPYDLAVVVPNEVPNELMMGSLEHKLEFLGGLIDSPICELGDTDGIYRLYISCRYENLINEIFAFIRSLCLGVSRKIENGVCCISFNITKYIDIIPIKDEMKECYDYASVNRFVSVTRLCRLSKNDKIIGRKVKVNNGFFLVGYSLATVC